MAAVVTRTLPMEQKSVSLPCQDCGRNGVVQDLRVWGTRYEEDHVSIEHASGEPTSTRTCRYCGTLNRVRIEWVSGNLSRVWRFRIATSVEHLVGVAGIYRERYGSSDAREVMAARYEEIDAAYWEVVARV